MIYESELKKWEADLKDTPNPCGLAKAAIPLPRPNRLALKLIKELRTCRESLKVAADCRDRYQYKLPAVYK